MIDIEAIRRRAHDDATSEAADTDDLIRTCNAAMMDRNVLLAEVERLTADLASARGEERAAVVAYLRDAADNASGVGWNSKSGALRESADAVEYGRHREKA